MKKLFIILFTLPITILGVETKFISNNNFQNIWLWQLSNTSIDYEQGISLPNNASATFETEEVLWSVEKIKQEIFLGTANNAKIIKLNQQNIPTNIYSNENKSIVTAIKSFQDGFIASFAPEGEIVQFGADNSVITNITVTNNYLWDIVPTSGNHAYVLAGTPAEVYEYTNNKLSSLGAIANEEHLIKGIFLNNDLWILGEKALYKKQNNKFIAIASFNGTASDFTVTNNTFYVAISSVKSDESKKETLTSSLISVTTKGIIDTLFSIQGFYFTGIGTHNRGIILGADQFGFYVHYDLVTKKSRFSSLGEGKIIKVLNKDKGNFQLVTSDLSRIWDISNQQATEGSFISEIYDTANISTWGIFNAQVSTPPNTSVTFFVQSGATPDADYWSDWQPVQLGQKIPTPNARYIRYKAILKSSNASVKPYVHSVNFPYQEINLAPTINQVNIIPDSQSITLNWVATDPNKDFLSYNIYLGDDGLAKIKINQDPITNTNYTFSTTFYPSGYKRITVEATDSASNPDALALKSTYNTIPVLFDGDRPLISNLTISGKILTFTVTDTTSNIAFVEVAINGGSQIISLQPNDKLFDSKTEQFTYTLPDNKSILITVIAEDSAGNVNSRGISLP